MEPHFLFNTLANVRELVNAGSPQASTVLDSLIAYLRAAVPRLHEAATTMGQEIELVRAYLELMQMRMPDRLQFSLQSDAAAQALRCPPTTLPLSRWVECRAHASIGRGRRPDRWARCAAGRSLRRRGIETGRGLEAARRWLGTGLSVAARTPAARLRRRCEARARRDCAAWRACRGELPCACP